MVVEKASIYCFLSGWRFLSLKKRAGVQKPASRLSSVSCLCDLQNVPSLQLTSQVGCEPWLKGNSAKGQTGTQWTWSSSCYTSFRYCYSFCYSQADPKELIKMVTRHVTRYGCESWPEDLASLTKQLHYYNERLLDSTEAQILQGLRKGVDVQRFTADDQYKRETILGLAE